MMDPLLAYAVFFLTLVGIYALLALGLNVQWGFAGLFNIGIAAFFSVGAYASAILTRPESNEHLGGFALPLALGWVGAMITAGVLALLVGLITLRLREDYLAIASIGIAEIVRLALKNEEWLTNGVRGIGGIVHPFAELSRGARELAFLALVLAIVAIAYAAFERARQSPWGRAVRAIREGEVSAVAAGKNAMVFRLQAFTVGSMIMGLAGAVYAHFIGFISPEAFDPMFATFLVWVMLIIGGSGNNRGALLGAFAIWFVWSGTEYLTSLLPAEMVARAGALRLLLVGLLLQLVLLTRPQGLLPEERFVNRALTRKPAQEAQAGKR
ncbi:branched-chain amino acid ABC transporter permease [Bradyrhizobium icense]